MWRDYLRRDPNAPIFVHKEEAFKNYDEMLAKIFAKKPAAEQNEPIKPE